MLQTTHPSATIGSRLEANKGIALGFDFVRIFLSVSVVAVHVYTIVTSKTDIAYQQFIWFPYYALLSAFFALSGFLIAGSAQRLSLNNFLINRGLRIVPALAVEILLSAFVLGPIFTSLELGDYLRSPQTWHYLTNIVGLINYRLPGVFEDLPVGIVNLTLWTVPHEVACYILMSGLILFRFIHKPFYVLGIAVAWICAGFAGQAAGFVYQSHGLERIYYALFMDNGSRLYVSFVLGILVYQFRDRVPHSRAIVLGCLVWCAALSTLSWDGAINHPLMNALATPPLVYLTMFVGTSDIPMPQLLRKGDYSYGIYLYGWPMQQVVMSLAPPSFPMVGHFIAAMVLVLAFSAFSWHFIERPILQLRHKFSFVARVRLAQG